MSKTHQPEQETSSPEPETSSALPDLTGGLGNQGMLGLVDKEKPSGALTGGLLGGTFGTLLGGPLGGLVGGLGGAWLGDWLSGGSEQAESTSGPTKSGPDLTNFKKATAGGVALSDAPDKITLPPDLVKGMGEAWGDSFPGGKSQEQGGIYVENADGSYEWKRGKAGTSGTFSPNWGDKDSTETMRAVMHTHPYDKTEGGMEDVTFSGGDFSSLIYQDSPQLDLLQSGKSQYGLMQSKEFRDQVAGLDDKGKAKMGQDMESLYDSTFKKHKGTFQEKCEAASKAVAGKYKIAYYKGKEGELSRVDTSK